MSSFLPIPAIDIRAGRCVRLKQGDYGRETVYGDDPVEMARHWQSLGARRLHVVDLDAARDGVRVNAPVIQRLIAMADVPVQVGGGVRSVDTAETLLREGADRVVVGTAAAEHPDALAEWLERLGAEQLVVGVDARDGFVATHGWLETSALEATAFCRKLAELGLERVLYTDIARDGALNGPNVPAVASLIHQVPSLRVLASGGVSRVEDLRALADAGAEGAIIGTALYDGRLTLDEVLSAC